MINCISRTWGNGKFQSAVKKKSEHFSVDLKIYTSLSPFNPLRPWREQILSLLFLSSIGIGVHEIQLKYPLYWNLMCKMGISIVTPKVKTGITLNRSNRTEWGSNLCFHFNVCSSLQTHDDQSSNQAQLILLNFFKNVFFLRLWWRQLHVRGPYLSNSLYKHGSNFLHK